MTDWKTIADRRLRLFWLGLILGTLTGLAIAAPPYWIGMLPPCL